MNILTMLVLGYWYDQDQKRRFDEMSQKKEYRPSPWGPKDKSIMADPFTGNIREYYLLSKTWVDDGTHVKVLSKNPSRAVFDAMNRGRADKGLPPVTWEEYAYEDWK